MTKESLDYLYEARNKLILEIGNLKAQLDRVETLIKMEENEHNFTKNMG